MQGRIALLLEGAAGHAVAHRALPVQPRWLLGRGGERAQRLSVRSGKGSKPTAGPIVARDCARGGLDDFAGTVLTGPETGRIRASTASSAVRCFPGLSRSAVRCVRCGLFPSPSELLGLPRR
jgi:hypothetical protein